MSDTLGDFDGDDAVTAAGLLAGARNFFSLVERGFNSLRYNTAAGNLRRYRSGEGSVELYPDNEIERYPALLNSEDENRLDSR